MSSNEANNENIDVQSVEGEVEAGPEVTNLDAESEATGATESKLAELQAEVDSYKDQCFRAQAEMENVRRRAELDVEKAHKFALEKFAKELLPVVDSLEKAVESAGSAEQGGAIHEGVNMTLNMLVSALGKFNVEPIDPVGEPFDPQAHEAMSMVEAPGAEPNSVVAVMQKGYLLNGRLVRPAMVMVAKASAGTKIDEQA